MTQPTIEFRMDTSGIPHTSESKAGGLKFGFILISFLFVFSINSCSRAPGSKEQSWDLIGNMSGVELKVPDDYRGVGCEYEGESFWAPVKPPPKRTYQSRIAYISISAKWPDMQHKNQNGNMYSYREKDDYSKPGPKGSKEWLDIGVYINPATKIPGSLPAHVIKITREGYTTERSDLSYRQDFNNFLGLNAAIPEGLKADKLDLDNDIYYWDGDKKSFRNVSTVIRCDNGQSKEKFYLRCDQEYELSELDALVKVYYYKDMLLHWREIQAKSRALILSFTRQHTQQGS